ncbi:MAG: MerR family transcriptional regulator [Bacteroidetes bacterium]|nr:hypothetical protein AWN76_012365 [Rhodothermaceae bacterium RA]RMH66485.1 MAG: MerR family transcriptional regulator [Bacteroidota bacterium]
MTRSELARRAGVNPSTVRYYERVGVLPEPARTAAGYRVYTGEDVERLRFIQRAQALGFTLAEIADLLGLAVSGADCDAVRARAEVHRADVVAKIRDLERVRAALDDLIAACQDRRPTATCPILDALRHGAGLEPVSSRPTAAGPPSS